MRRGRLVAAVAIALLPAGCATLPPPPERAPSPAITDTGDTRLGRAVAPLAAGHPGLSGFHKFPEPRDAFAARMLLAGSAERAVDAQYYIWSGDEVGYLLFDALWHAAQRGVRVRLLLDDANTAGLDATLAALDDHPNAEVRLYNPFAFRGPRALGYAGDFARLNRRMHNKSFTVDNQVSIVGGRNIANEYFGAGSRIGFADIDVLATGPVVDDISREFDRYWNSASAYPIAHVAGAPEAGAAARFHARAAAIRTDPVAIEYLAAVTDAPLLGQLREHTLDFEWTTAEVMYDDPGKTLDAAARDDVLLFPELMRRLGRPAAGIDIVSPYFVPGDAGSALLADLARRGVRVRVLTNSLAASDEAVVHTGYATRRRDLLAAGVELWELKPNANDATAVKVEWRFGSGKVAGLHAKTYAVDRARIFVGSFNFDQRSARLNTEMGLVIDSPQLAGQLAAFFDTAVRDVAYRVTLSADGAQLVWTERTAAGDDLRYDRDPGTTVLDRLKVELLSLLPIEWLL